MYSIALFIAHPLSLTVVIVIFGPTAELTGQIFRNVWLTNGPVGLVLSPRQLPPTAVELHDGQPVVVKTPFAETLTVIVALVP